MLLAQTANPTFLPAAASIGWVIAGIIFSLILPLAVNTLIRSKGLEGGLEGQAAAEKPSWFSRLAMAWKAYGGPKYTAILLAAVVVAVAIVWLMGLKFYTERDASLAGFAWESLIHKLAGKGDNPCGGA